MNILVFSWRDPIHPLAGGAEQVMHEHMKGWIKKGHEVTLFSSRFKGSRQKETLDEVQIIRKGYQYLGVQVSGFFYFLGNKKKYDFVVDQFHGLPFFTPLYIKKPKLAVIQEPAREVWFKNPLPFPLNIIIGVIGYIFEPFIFLFYKKTKFMTGSMSAKKDVTKLGIPNKNITVVPHGVILPKKKIKTGKEKQKTIVFLGILSKDKGIEDAIKCFSFLENDYNLWVVGKPETQKYGKRIKKIAKRAAGNNIKFWGHVDKIKKFELLSRAHILINPSMREGWGLVNIEANSVKTPVIAYNSAGLIDSVKNGVSGIILNKNTPQDMARKVEEILDSKEEYEKLCEGAYEWSKNFDWQKSKEKSLRLTSKISS